ncbi:MAG TPA: flavoprotein [Lachnospiraceae bacterium]|nr:flavoprotein [Lachnospiraceae bacterium]
MTPAAGQEHRTLILTGSPRKKGHTASMTDYLAQRLTGQTEILSLDDRRDIRPCRDCRYCFTHGECCIKDAMEEICQKLEQADRIVFAAPVYFYNIPGSMKSVLDRLQVYWAAVLRGDKKEPVKKGGLLLAGGAPEFPEQFTGSIQTLKCMLDDLGAVCEEPVTMGGTDKKGLSERPDVQARLKRLADRLNA